MNEFIRILLSLVIMASFLLPINNCHLQKAEAAIYATYPDKSLKATLLPQIKHVFVDPGYVDYAYVDYTLRNISISDSGIITGYADFDLEIINTSAGDQAALTAYAYFTLNNGVVRTITWEDYDYTYGTPVAELKGTKSISLATGYSNIGLKQVELRIFGSATASNDYYGESPTRDYRSTFTYNSPPIISLTSPPDNQTVS